MKKYKIIISTWHRNDIEEIREFYIHSNSMESAKQTLHEFINDDINIISCSHCYEGF